jgi:hypothetical protein
LPKNTHSKKCNQKLICGGFDSMYKKIFLILSVMICISLNAQITFLLFDFEGNTLQPPVGTGTATYEGGTAGATSGEFAAGNPGRAWNTSSYPAQGTNPQTAGIRITTSTVGYHNIRISWDNMGSNTAANRLRLQYTTDGNTWQNFEANASNATNVRQDTGDDAGFDNGLYIHTIADSRWFNRSADLSGIPGLNDNPNFAVRFVTAFPSGASAYAPVTSTMNYNGPTGTIRYDNITFQHTDVSTVLTPVASPSGGLFIAPISVTLTSNTPDATIRFTTDGSTPSATHGTIYTTPIDIAITTTLRFIATKTDMSPSIVVTETYNFPTEVNTIAELRTLPQGPSHRYILPNEVVVTYTQAFRNQKFIQDDTAGILIDDNTNIITTAFQIGDGITGLVGSTNTFDGMLQFLPAFDPGTPSSTANHISPTAITMAQFINSYSTYESMLVVIENVTFVNPVANITLSSVHPVTDGTDTINFRATFQADYIGAPLPATPINLIGIPNERAGSARFITSRFLADFAPTANTVIAPIATPPGGIYSAPVSVTLATETEDATIYFTTDGSAPTTTNGTIYTTPIQISATTTLRFFATKTDMSPSSTRAETYTFPEAVSNLAELRAKPVSAHGPSNIFILSNEVIVSFTQAFRNQKFIQDNTAGILIEDNPGVITTEYQIGDGITGLAGYIEDFNGLLQFIPLADPGTPSSTENIIVPVVASLSQLNANPNMYQSRLVRINSLSFTNPTGNFATGTTYSISDGTQNSANIRFRTTFFDADYIGTPIPAQTIDLVCIPTTRADGSFVTARSLEDIILDISTIDIVAHRGDHLISNYPNPFNPTTTIIYEIATDTHVCIRIFNIKGQRVKSLVDDTRIAGKHYAIWDGTDDHGRYVASGIYYYQMATTQGVQTKKAVLLK